ncbi:protein NRT1/ PTR FAMILY 4.6-like [Chenopodium quinoa]|uniref:protein NRT1/ PTR FAMILY 4.6-like n=1 Tax=Chenopodium quinoa TaxID=63459 RepID=UPI000B77A0F6|nr:protein NRT1/ PTR FAMILY 4.6-like [Chenopodium quinoa]
MDVENHQLAHKQQGGGGGEKWEGYVDWKGRPARRGRHGGFISASFVLVVEVMENMAFLANASNLVLYVSKYMHFTPSKSSNTVTNFMGTAFLLALLGGFLSDAFFTTYQVYLTSALIEFLGLIVLTVQAYKPSLQPPQCNPKDPTTPCREPNTSEAAMLYIGLYLVAAGVGGIKGSLPTHGAEQFDESTSQGRIKRSTFFNYFVFCLSAGGLIATTFVVWVEDNKGWKWGFFISTLSILLSIPVFLGGSPFYRNKIPSGSPLTTISKVLIAATLNSCMSKNTSNAVANLAVSPQSYPLQTSKEGEQSMKGCQEIIKTDPLETLTESFKSLNNAVNSNPFSPSLKCTIKEVEEVKIVLKIFPIFASTILLNCCLAQLSTFSVEQAASMDTNLGSLKVPPASLPVFPIVIIMVLAPVYDHIIIPFARNITKRETGISHLQRIGVGLILSVAAMAVAALVEVKRKQVAIDQGMVDSVEPLPLTFFWIAIQYALLGSADLFCLAGMLEFFFTEAPSSMRSLATSLSWASLAIGYYLSSVIVSIINAATRRGHDEHNAWLAGSNLNRYHLERFYWLLCVLGALNFLNYLFWACKYKYRSTGSIR